MSMRTRIKELPFITEGEWVSNKQIAKELNELPRMVHPVLSRMVDDGELRRKHTSECMLYGGPELIPPSALITQAWDKNLQLYAS